MNQTFFLVAFWTLFPILNPIGAMGPFLTMTARDDLKKRRSIAGRAALVSGIVLIFCTAVGGFFFQFFGISLPALKVAGGILLLLISVDMLNVRLSRVKATTEEQEEGIQKEDIAVFPLAIPLLSGPGSIASVFMLVDQAKTVSEHASIYLAILATTAIVYLILREAHRVTVVLGKIGFSVMSRLMGLVLASMAIQFILDGLAAAFPGLTG